MPREPKNCDSLCCDTRFIAVVGTGPSPFCWVRLVYHPGGFINFFCPFFLSTVLAIAGEDFSIVASDTRLSEGFSIHTRDSPKCYKL